MSSRLRARLFVAPLEDRWTPAAGDLDFGFGTQGVYRFPSVPVDGGISTTQANFVAAAPGGRVVTVGYGNTVSADGVPDFNRTTVAVNRLTADGRPDATFDADGQADIPFGYPSAVLVQPDGRVLVIGTSRLDSTAGPAVFRLTADGRPDPTFGNNGLAALPDEAGRFNAVALRPDGGIVLAGTVGPGHPFFVADGPITGFSAFAVAQLLPDGRLDPRFDADGLAAVFFPVGELNQANGTAVTVQPDGKVVLAGSASVDVTVVRSGRPIFQPTRRYGTQFAVARLNADGSLDGGFGDNGTARLAFGAGPQRTDQAAAVQVRPDGRVVVAGAASPSSLGATPVGAVAVLSPAGRPDPGYDGDGLAVTPVAVSGRATVLPDGGVLFVSNDRLARLTAAGQPDPAFGPDGSSPLPFQPRPGGDFNYPYLNLNGSAVLPDGRVVAGGTLFPDRDSRGQSVVVGLQGVGPVRFAPAAPGTFQAGGSPDGSVAILTPTAGGYSAVGGLTAFPDFEGTARTATADVNGDGVPDFVVGAGPGGGPNVQLFDGVTGSKFANLDVFEQTFSGGVFVAAEDLNGDGKAEVVVTPDQGGGPVVAIFDGARLAAGQDNAAQLGRFFGIEDEAFRGGARPALGDVNADGKADLVVAAGFGGGPRVAVFDGGRVLDPTRFERRFVPLGTSGRAQLVTREVQVPLPPPKLVGDFFVFEESLRNGVFVSAGDLNADGFAEVVVGGGPGGGPRVMALDGRSLSVGTQTPVANFFAGDSTSRGGVRVAVRPGADGEPRLVTGSGDGEAAAVRVYTAGVAVNPTQPPEQTLSPFGGAALANGVFVG